MSTVREIDDTVAPATLERLRKSKADANMRDARQGDRDGRDWALRRAEWRHLQVMEEMAQEFEDVCSFDADSPGCLEWALANRLRVQHGEEHGVDDLRAALFPEPLRRHSPQYIAAFIQSAAAVCREVVDQI